MTTLDELKAGREEAEIETKAFKGHYLPTEQDKLATIHYQEGIKAGLLRGAEIVKKQEEKDEKKSKKKAS